MGYRYSGVSGVTSVNKQEWNKTVRSPSIIKSIVSKGFHEDNLYIIF